MQTTFEAKPFAPSTSVPENGERRDGLIISGYILLSASVVIYGISEYVGRWNEDNSLSIFLVHYVLALLFVIFLWRNNAYGISRSWKKENIHRTIVLLNLFLVSAYALNRSIPVFHESVPWLCVYLMVTSVASLCYRYYTKLQSWVQAILQVVLGSALVFYAYLIIYTLPFVIFGGIGIILLGIGAHIFVPITLFYGIIVLLRQTYRAHDRSLYWIAIGAVLTIGYASVFAWEWKKRERTLGDLYYQSLIQTESDLPVMVSVAQKIKPDWITLRMLKADLVYSTSQIGRMGIRLPDVSFAEGKRHDPLVFFSTVFSKSTLSGADRREILKILFGKRHETEERFWSGSDLSTTHVVSDIDIYPDLRIAYQEKYLTIDNRSGSSWSRQEALYTFQLPEGSVVTSLSLWIDGKEEKGILTSKQKAARAYNRIVGVEVRDPSVIHWQEGNRVTVRIFPCTSQEQRKVKIGITSPLMEVDGRLKLQSIGLQGPDFSQARETCRVRFVGPTQNIELPAKFKRDSRGNFVSEGDFVPDFDIAFDVVPLKENQFTFDGNTYSIEHARSVNETVTIQDLYLDINNNWTTDECNAIKPLMNTKNVWVWVDSDFVKLGDHNFDSLSKSLRQYNFSLFPFYHLKDRRTSLVVTKGDQASPHLGDLKDSPYSKKMQEYFAIDEKVRVFNLGGEAPAGIRSLRELRGIEYASGSAEALKTLLRNKQFPRTEESGNSVVLNEAGLRIRKESSATAGMEDNAPDHLARLFAYNDIMRKVGHRFYAEEDYVNEDLVSEAMAAYVVSPVSSLVVLERQEDYKRFDIEASKNSLQNASKNSSGAVPEPHEWALIILFGLVVVYLKFKR